MTIVRASAVFLLWAGGAMAQSDPPPKFDVSSVKPAAPDARGMFIRNMPGGTLNVTNMPLTGCGKTAPVVQISSPIFALQRF